MSILVPDERIYYRDRLRAARYSALADSEGFLAICFALEELGVRALGRQAALNDYHDELVALISLAEADMQLFNALYDIVRRARNDAMHTGAHARHVAAKAIELCLILEDALMATNEGILRRVGDHMVKDAIAIEAWQPVSRARQLMLTHSFSNLPVRIGDSWKLLTERGLAKYLAGNNKNKALGATISQVAAQLSLEPAVTTKKEADADSLLVGATGGGATSLWIVIDGEQHLLGVISAFELI